MGAYSRGGGAHSSVGAYSRIYGNYERRTALLNCLGCCTWASQLEQKSCASIRLNFNDPQVSRRGGGWGGGGVVAMLDIFGGIVTY